MAIQIVCFYCDKRFLMHSANTMIEQLELDWKKVEIECPHCQKVNQEFLAPPKRMPADPSVAVEDSPTAEEQEAQALAEGFYREYLPDENPPKIVDVFDESGGLIAQVGKLEVQAEEERPTKPFTYPNEDICVCGEEQDPFEMIART